MNLEKYHFRPSFYNLVELSLLARMYIEHCLPLADQASSAEQLPQTLLMMKSTEQKGQLHVAICGEDPIGFLWQYEGRLISVFVHPDHRNQGVEDQLKSFVKH